MSFPPNDNAAEAEWQAMVASDAWNREIVPKLPKELEEQAFLLGAIARTSGKIRSVSDLLRVLLAYGQCAGSFRSLAIWAATQGIADLSHVAWRERMQKAGEWLDWLLNEQVRPEACVLPPSLKKAGYGPLELLDASHFKGVGKEGKTYRFHCMYSLCTQQLHQVKISDMSVAEGVINFTIQKGMICVGDSAHGYRKEFALLDDAGAYAVAAFFPKTFPLEDADGKAIDLIAWLKKARAREGQIKQLSAFFWHEGKRYAVRVVALKRTQDQTKRDLQKKKKAGRKKKNLQKDTLYLSKWMLVVTTLPEKDWSAQEILSLYRARWQIEIFFKRIKQLFKVHTLRSKTAKTARATVASILVGWTLQQTVAVEMRSVFTELHRELEEGSEKAVWEEEKIQKVVNEWRLQEVSVDLFRRQVQGTMTEQRMQECFPRMERHFKDMPRKRIHEWQRVMNMFVGPQIPEDTSKGGENRKTGSALTSALA